MAFNGTLKGRPNRTEAELFVGGIKTTVIRHWCVQRKSIRLFVGGFKVTPGYVSKKNTSSKI